MPWRLLDERLTSTLRVFAASVSLVVCRLDPSEDTARRPLAFTVLSGFVAYSALHWVLVRRGSRRVPLELSPWVDLGWTTLLVFASDGWSSVFFPLYLFSILCASFTGGFRAGRVNVVAASFVSFALVGAATASSGGTFELGRTLIRPMYLTLLGYLIAYWGEHQRRLRARFALLREVTALSNPRFGVDRMVQRLLDALHRFYGADGTHLVVSDAARDTASLRSAPRADTAVTPPPTALPPGLEALAPDSLGDAALAYSRSRVSRGGELQLVGDGGATSGAPIVERAAEIAALLGFASFITVPFRQGLHERGRLYLGSARRNAFDDSDAAFLLHVAEQVAPVLENIRLVDQLASQAAEEERRRIGRDLHDSVIQPYVGLLLGMGTVDGALEVADVDGARRHLLRLRQLAEEEIRDLRTFVGHLRDTAEAARGDAPLRNGLARFCSRFAEATGIRVDLDAECLAQVNDRVAGEVFQLVGEALSNVRRHTESSRAGVQVAVVDGTLRLRVENDGALGTGPRRFSPRSLTERAVALGGALEVVEPCPGTVAIDVQIPL